jgi:hypothetical protein
VTTAPEAPSDLLRRAAGELESGATGPASLTVEYPNPDACVADMMRQRVRRRGDPVTSTRPGPVHETMNQHKPGDSMKNITRIFTPEELEEIGVPYELPDDAEVEGLAYELHRKQTFRTAWASVHEIVFRAPDDGKAYRATFQVPLTEHQECDTWFDEKEIKAVEVELRPVTVRRWKPVEAAQAAAEVTT